MSIVIPEIPQACMNKSFRDIKWVKTVNDKITNSAYLHPDPRLKQFPIFCLELNSRFRNSLMQVPIGDIILLHQRLDKQSVRCFTHLVTPIDNNLIQHPYPSTIKGWCGRWVKVIAMTGNQAINGIPVLQTMWPSMGFAGKMRDLSFQCGRVFEIPTNQQLPKLQNDIWNRFQPHIV
jgi:hypothetical protein